MKIALETELMQVLVVDKFAMYNIKAGVVDQNMPLDISLTKFFVLNSLQFMKYANHSKKV